MGRPVLKVRMVSPYVAVLVGVCALFFVGVYVFQCAHKPLIGPIQLFALAIASLIFVLPVLVTEMVLFEDGAVETQGRAVTRKSVSSIRTDFNDFFIPMTLIEFAAEAAQPVRIAVHFRKQLQVLDAIARIVGEGKLDSNTRKLLEEKGRRKCLSKAWRAAISASVFLAFTVFVVCKLMLTKGYYCP